MAALNHYKKAGGCSQLGIFSFNRKSNVLYPGQVLPPADEAILVSIFLATVRDPTEEISNKLDMN